MKCKKCGKKLRKNELFCTVCGYYNDPKQEEQTSSNDDDFDLTNEDWGSKEDKKTEKEEEKELDKILKEGKKKEKKETPKEEKVEIELEDDEDLDEDERYTKAYIGEDYNIIKNSFINIWAFLFSWIYFLYRKLFITGIIGLVITYLVLVFANNIIIPYMIGVCILSGLLFNKYYIFVINNRIKGIHNKYEGSDSNTLEDICKEKGGVNFIYPLIIYFIFLVVVILSLSSIGFNRKNNTRFFNENNENKANCNTFLKTAYSNLESTYKEEKLTEAVCKIVKTPTKEYVLYLKTQNNTTINYYYYRVYKDRIEYKGNTEELIEIQKKKELTKEDQERKSDLINVKADYGNIYNQSRQEDELVSKKKNTEEKLNFVFSRVEVIR